MMWWALCCVAVVVGSVYADAAPSSDFSHTIDWTQLEPAPDDESIEYSVSPGGRFPSAPLFYLLTDLPRDSQVPVEKMERSRRTVYLSVNPAIDLLQRGAYNSYIERQALANREFLNCIGKRDPRANSDCKA